MESIHLIPDREKSTLRKHPWIFSGSIERITGKPDPGETVKVLSASGKCLGFGAYSPHSQIRVRMWSFDPAQKIDPIFLRQRFRQALKLRQDFFKNKTVNAFRVVNSESDGLPGMIIDQYDSFVVCQFLSVGAEYHKSIMIDVIRESLPCRGIYERSDTDSRQREGLKRVSGLLWGEEPPELIDIREEDYRFWVDVRKGHKTGFYLDQRENRRMLSQFAANKRVLNTFSYTGGFGVAAMHAGAGQVINVDSSRAAIELAQKNFQLNGFSEDQTEFIKTDVFDFLRSAARDQQRFDLIILDPPKFAEASYQVMQAARGYKDINRLAFDILSAGGILFTFSCSAAIEPLLFQKIVADAALDARRDAKILHWLSQSGDHTVDLNYPEGRYLKGLVVRVE